MAFYYICFELEIVYMQQGSSNMEGLMMWGYFQDLWTAMTTVILHKYVKKHEKDLSASVH